MREITIENRKYLLDLCVDVPGYLFYIREEIAPDLFLTDCQQVWQVERPSGYATEKEAYHAAVKFIRDGFINKTEIQ